MNTWMIQLAWRCLAVIGLILAVVGTILPIMPTVPFVIMTAWAASNGWPALERWLLEHPLCGQHIKLWREKRAIPLKAKWFATLAMLFSSISIWWMPFHFGFALVLDAVLLLTVTWVWSRPHQ